MNLNICINIFLKKSIFCFWKLIQLDFASYAYSSVLLLEVLMTVVFSETKRDMYDAKQNTALEELVQAQNLSKDLMYVENHIHTLFWGEKLIRILFNLMKKSLVGTVL